MTKKSLNQLLAENLAAAMDAQKLSANKLGALANLSPRTIANYLKVDHNPTATGKERSAKLSELDQLAGALKIDPRGLLYDLKLEGPSGVYLVEMKSSQPRGPAGDELAADLSEYYEPSFSPRDQLDSALEIVGMALAAAPSTARRQLGEEMRLWAEFGGQDGHRKNVLATLTSNETKAGVA